MIKIKFYEYQVHEILIILNSLIHKLKEEKERPENECIFSSIVIKISIYERIRDVLENSLNKE